jgi:hypothetical protein
LEFLTVPRIRTIKPEFWRDDSLSKVSAEAALLAIGLLNHADDDGYFNANPKLIEADIFPLRELSGSVTGMVQELAGIGYIKLFSAPDGRRYGCIANFDKHQVINKKNPSKIKDLCTIPEDYGSTTVALPVGKERKGKEKEGEKEQGKRFALFDVFWKAYPKKVAKDDARRAFEKRKPDKSMVDSMLAAIFEQINSPAWQRDDGQYIPNPATWLNGGRWEDGGPPMVPRTPNKQEALEIRNQSVVDEWLDKEVSNAQ